MASSEICSSCRLAHRSASNPALVPADCSEAQSAAMKALLKNVADEGICRGCLAPVFWLRHKNGRPTPYDASGLNHFISCPNREQFKKAKA